MPGRFTITTSIKLDAQKSILAKERKEIKLSPSSSSIKINFDESFFSNFNQAMLELATINVTPEVGLHTTLYETYMQNVSLNVKFRDGTVNNW